jgi:hypothetical protein
MTSLADSGINDLVTHEWYSPEPLRSDASALAGCQTRTICVPAGEPVRLREPVKGAKVWVADEKGQWTAGEIDIPAGWYALPDPGPDGAGPDPDAPIQ